MSPDILKDLHNINAQGIDPRLVVMISGVCSDTTTMFKSVNRYQVSRDEEAPVPSHPLKKGHFFRINSKRNQCFCTLNIRQEKKRKKPRVQNETTKKCGQA